MKRLLKTSAALAVLVAIGLLWLKGTVDSYMAAPMSLPDDGLTIEIKPGSSFATVTSMLMDQGAIENDRWFRFYARYTEQAGAIHAGEYVLPTGSTPLQALQQFTAGDVRLYPLTIVEGWNYRELLAALHSHDAIVASLTDEDLPALLESMGAGTTHPEGLFLPETYRVPRGTRDVDVLQQAYKLMQTVLAEEWSARSEDTGVESPYEALILASIIEKETARVDERGQISGVFTRRLEQRMRLQTDPTVIYGIGPAFDGNLTRKNLRTDTPYNTYTRHGLPPTPIAMPGREAIRAALQPAEGSALYFVATGRSDGSHRFSDTKADHDQAVADYLRQLRRNRQGH